MKLYSSLLLAATCCPLLLSQSRISLPSQVHPDPSLTAGQTLPVILAITPQAAFISLKLGAGLTYDPASSTLSCTSQAPNPAKFTVQVSRFSLPFAMNAATGSFTLANTANVDMTQVEVFRNGVLMANGPDYKLDVASNTVTMVAQQMPQAGDVWQFKAITAAIVQQ